MAEHAALNRVMSVRFTLDPPFISYHNEMTVKELIAELSKLPPERQDCEIWLQKDPEGNGYEALRDVDLGLVSEDSYGEDILSEDWDFDEAGFESEEEWEQHKRECQKVVVLFP